MDRKAEVLMRGFLFPESPRWHRGSFYCNSIDEGTLYKIGLDGTREELLKIDDWLSGWYFVAPDSDDIVYTSALKRKLMSSNWKESTEIADLSHLVNFSVNDMVGTKNGHKYIGGVDPDFNKVDHTKMPSSPLLQVSPSGEVSVASDITGFPNGMVITPDDKKLIMADSRDWKVYQWDLAEDGTLASDHSVFAEVAGQVDGISLDEGGGLWVTLGGVGVHRVLEGGQVTDRIDVGNTGATACMLGGPDGRTLLITCSDSHDRKVMAENPSGHLQVVTVDIPGVGLPSWY